MANRKCRMCEKVLPESAFPNNGTHPTSGNLIKRSYCKDCCSVRAKANYDPEYMRRKNIEKYGITVEEYGYILAAQKGLCATCGSSTPGSSHAKNFCIDHNHVTGQIRGLLCVPCNTALGLINDRIEVLGEMISYVKNGGTIGGSAEEVEKSQTF